MHTTPVRIILLASLGIALATVASFAALVLFHKLFGATALLHRALRTTVGFLPFLVPAGALSGVILLREYSLKSPATLALRLVYVTVLSVVTALGQLASLRTLQYVRFYMIVLRPQFDPTASEALVRSRLGPPSFERGAPHIPLSSLVPSTCTQPPARSLGYHNPYGHSYRELYFDTNGRYLCDETGNVW